MTESPRNNRRTSAHESQKKETGSRSSSTTLCVNACLPCKHSDYLALSGAGLDVHEGKELVKEEKQLVHDPKNIEDLANLVKDHVLLSKDNIVFTPHIAFYSKKAMERILETTVENVAAFVSGKPQNVV